MKVYIVQYNERYEGSGILGGVLGVFSSLELAKQEHVHEWVEFKPDSFRGRSWVAVAASPTYTSITITEFEVK